MRLLGQQCREQLSGLLPLRAHELEFLTRLNEFGQVVPDLLTPDLGLQATILAHPGLQWKAQHVAQYRRRQ